MTGNNDQNYEEAEGQPKLVLALPIYEKRKIVIVSDEMIDGERVVCIATEQGYCDQCSGINGHHDERCANAQPSQSSSLDSVSSNPDLLDKPAAEAEEPCTEPDRANCPRLCIDFCNKEEVRKADETEHEVRHERSGDDAA